MKLAGKNATHDSPSIIIIPGMIITSTVLTSHRELTLCKGDRVVLALSFSSRIGISLVSSSGSNTTSSLSTLAA
jgi:hypothetical protein